MSSAGRLVLRDVLRNPVIRRVPVQWGEMDAFQHVNNTVYFKYFEIARIAYFDALVEKIHLVDTENTFDHTGFMSGRGVGPILAATSCSFKFPLTYPDEALVAASIHPEDVHELGFGMTYTVWSTKHGRPAAVGRGEVTSFDYPTGKVAPFPAVVREAIEALERDDSLHMLDDIERLKEA